VVKYLSSVENIGLFVYPIGKFISIFPSYLKSCILRTRKQYPFILFSKNIAAMFPS
jgi:hypothetical protein